jgi:hypothetical protein
MYYAVTDTSFNILSQSATSTQSIYPTAICLNKSKVAILSAGQANITPGFNANHFFASLNVMDKAGSNNYVNDLTVISVQEDSVYATNTPPGNSQLHLRAKIKIKNNGPRIDNFKINCYMYPSIICGTYIYQQNVSKTLLTSDTAIVTTGWVTKYGSASGNSVSAQYCFYTSLPDGTTDKVLADNELCQTYSGVPTGIDESDLLSRVSVYPNPAESFLVVETEFNIQYVEVLNSLGSMITRYDSNLTKSYDINELPAGIYFVKLGTERGTVIKKIIKS